MNARSLPLPAGLAWAQHIEDMRELAQFDIHKDCYVWRWDTEVLGIKQTWFADQPKATDCPDPAFGEKGRKEAKEYFLRIELGMPPK